jgi:DNA end-binding protein Ku
MRAIWKGAVSFGLVNVPVRVYAATQEHGFRFHQVHQADGGRVRMRRVCSVCDDEVAYDQLAKGYESPDGRLAVLTDEDFAGLPLASGREIEVLEFVPSGQVDPILFDRTYYLEPDARAAKPYALLREALAATDRMAVVKVALRQRESMAVLRVRDRVIVMQTLLWPDEVRSPDFDVLGAEMELREQELAMAESLIDSLAADFTPDDFEDRYAAAVSALIDAKLAGAAPMLAGGGAQSAGIDVVDLLTALQQSVERARAARGDTPAEATGTSTDDAPGASADAPTDSAGTSTADSTADSTGDSTGKAAGRAAATPTGTSTARKAATKKATARKKATTRRKSA